MFTVNHVTKRYGKLTANRDISWVEDGRLPSSLARTVRESPPSSMHCRTAPV